MEDEQGGKPSDVGIWSLGVYPLHGVRHWSIGLWVGSRGGRWWVIGCHLGILPVL